MSSIINFFKTNIIIILIVLLPPFFTIGPALIELVSLIFFVIFLTLYLKKDNQMMELINENKYIIRIFFLFWFLLLILSFFSEDYYLSFKNTGFYFRFFTFTLFILYCLDNYRRLKYLLFYTYVFLFILIFLTSVYELFTGYNFFNNAPHTNGRVSSIFLDEKILGSFICKNLPIIIALVYFNKFKYKFFIIFSFTFLSLILIILSGERSALFLFLIFVILSMKIIDFRKITISVLIFLAFLISINPKYLSNASTNRIISNTLVQVGLPLLGNNERVRLFSPVHEHHYIAAFKMFLDNPMLGIGPNNFREQCKKTKFKVNKIPFLEDKIYARNEGYILNKVGKNIYFLSGNVKFERDTREIELSEKFKSLLNNDFNNKIKFNKGDYIYSYKKNLDISGCNTHPHNYMLQFLAETGILGFLFYISLFCFCLFKIISIIFNKNQKKYPEYLALISIILSIFPLLPSGNFFNNMISFSIFWNIPFYLFFLKKFNK
jgi:O-antigen ligase